MSVMDWNWFAFDELSGADVYDMLHLRQQIFVLEQTCLYPDIDGRDPTARHCLGRDANGTLLAYLRLFAPIDGQATIGRVVVAKQARGTGLGRELMQVGIAHSRTLYPDDAIWLGAQAHLQGFYGSLGFQPISAIYDEDGIPHIDMLLQKE